MSGSTLRSPCSPGCAVRPGGPAAQRRKKPGERTLLAQNRVSNLLASPAPWKVRLPGL